MEKLLSNASFKSAKSVLPRHVGSNGKKCKGVGERSVNICQYLQGKIGDDSEKLPECDSGKYKDCKACDTDDQCSNGKKCRLTEGGGDKTCQCPPGKSGNDCETIDDCDSGKYKDCNGDNGKCEYDDQEETAVCRCEGGKILDEKAGTCKACDTDDQCSNA
ncbi:hypothetical protein TNIN_337751, partial [Trichonephila inaurata madagascariensis]